MHCIMYDALESVTLLWHPIGYSKENLKIHMGVPSPPFLPSLTIPLPYSPLLPSLPSPPSPPFLYPLPLKVGPLKSS